MPVDLPVPRSGALGPLTLSHAWDTTPLGAVGRWPTALRTAVGLLLHSPMPMLLAWGPSLTQLYNDAAATLLGDRHPAALGAPAEVAWADLWPTLGPAWRRALQGEASTLDGLRLGAHRVDAGEPAVFDLSCSPVPGDDGRPAGVLVTLLETTASVRSARRARVQLALSDGLRGLTEPGDITAFTCSLLGREFDARRVGYATVADGTVDVSLRGWHDGTVQSVLGWRFPLTLIGEDVARELTEGRTVLLVDVARDPRTAAHRQVYDGLAAQSMLIVPVVRDGSLIAVVAVSGKTPRRWTADEIALTEDAAERTRAAVERALAERALALERQKERERLRALHESEERFRVMADSVPSIVWITDGEGRPVFFNRQWREYTGVGDDLASVAEVAQAVLHPDDAEPTLRAFEASQRTGETFVVEHRIRSAAGQWRWFLVRGVPHRVDGRIERWFGASVDIHDRRLTEEALRQRTAELERAQREVAEAHAESDRRRRLYETFLAHSPDLAYVFDLEHRFIYANEALLSMWGRSWEDAIGKGLLELGYEPWHAEMHDREIEQVKATRRPIRGEVPFQGTQGRRTYDYIFTPVLGPDGEVEAIAGTTRDVTERKAEEQRAQAALQEEQRRNRLLSQVAAASRELVAVLSIDRIAELLTQEARRLLGAHQAVTSLTVGEDGAQRVHAVSLSDRYAARRDDRQPPGGSALQAEVCRRNRPMRLTQDELQRHPASTGAGGHHDRHPPMRGWLAVPLVGHGGRNLGLVQLSDKEEGDFTEADESVLVQLAAIAATGIENARLYSALQDQDRRKDEFLATLAHELRNPLAPVRSGLEILRVAGGLSGPAARTRDMMERQLGHMVRLIDDLMDVARVSQGKVVLDRRRIMLLQLVETALDTSRPLIEAGRHELRLDVPEAPLALQGDLTRLSQVLSNLLNNAAKYTPEGGHITLRAWRDGGEVAIQVADDGIGIPPDMLATVFQLFTQVDRHLARAQGGLGIGLSLARRLVEMHGGTLRADSAGIGRGATFTLRLALDDAGGDAPHPEPATTGPPDEGRGLHVLVVDDNVDAADALATLLELDGHTVRLAHDGPAALDAADAFAADAAFLDIGMPGLSGYEVARALRARFGAGLLLVAVTGWGAAEDQRQARRAGFDAHLTKPADPVQVRALLQRQRAAPASG